MSGTRLRTMFVFNASLCMAIQFVDGLRSKSRKQKTVKIVSDKPARCDKSVNFTVRSTHRRVVV